MTSKDILVVTTSTLEGIKIKRYLKPVSAHIVAGTNLISDFIGGLSDVFGGRSQTYQKQLASLYNEAIERIKVAAFEIGGSAVLNLDIDIDEISGKGKSMFMITATGTAVILEKEVNGIQTPGSSETRNQVSADAINNAKTRKSVIAKAANGQLSLTDEVWSFITSNQVHEVFPFLLLKFKESFLADAVTSNSSAQFYSNIRSFIDNLPDEQKMSLLYQAIGNSNSENVANRLSQIIKDLYLLELDKAIQLMESENLTAKKRGLYITTYDKFAYNSADVLAFEKVRMRIQEILPKEASGK